MEQSYRGIPIGESFAFKLVLSDSCLQHDLYRGCKLLNSATHEALELQNFTYFSVKVSSFNEILKEVCDHIRFGSQVWKKSQHLGDGSRKSGCHLFVVNIIAHAFFFACFSHICPVFSDILKFQK